MTTMGFIGLGVMGLPMSLNLVRSGRRLVVWNRSPGPCDVLRAAGANVAATPAEVCRQAETVVLMLCDAPAIDEVLGRGSPQFAAQVAGRTLVHMGTTAPEYSRGLEADVITAGGRYVEAPVTGSRVPAEAGAFLGMVAGAPAAVASVRDLLAPLCREVVDCGAVPNATLTKLTSNIVLLSTFASLAEAVQTEDRFGVPREALLRVILGGQLASDILRIKGAKLVANDFSPQASIANAMASGLLTREASHAAGAETPLLDACLELYRRAHADNREQLDIVAVMQSSGTPS